MGKERGDDDDQGYGGSYNYYCAALRSSVKKLHFGKWEEKEEAAAEIKRLLAAGDDPGRRRRFMAELGVIPPLVDMAGCELVARRRLAVQALIHLAHASPTNKALMVESGILSKLSQHTDIADQKTIQESLQLLLSVSHIASFQSSIIKSSRIIPFIINIIDSFNNNNKIINLCLCTLYNLSLVLENSEILVSSGVINVVLRLLSSEESLEKALAILGNMVVTQKGKRALEEHPLVPECFIIETATADDGGPKCRELSVYVLTVLAHRSPVQRERMAKGGVVPALVEVALLGSALARKRALRLLEWFKDGNKRNVGTRSGPQIRSGSNKSPPFRGMKGDDEVRRLMKSFVKESLYRNMETITHRANIWLPSIESLPRFN
ncbi:hypothetical protein DM860_008015 [Cuscuta australis]|uniref:U-box domain-containing protein n=1 Tax=Cuscuta australis TaxID=267555 RepID=A0A328E1M1_9ASTE|nr:hypothetical protein DM860_008015 [Cuscuta australis]